MDETSTYNANVDFTVMIVTAYIGSNPLSPADVPDFISRVHQAVTALGGQAAPLFPELTPAVPIKKSVQPDFIICLEDGMKFKSLKRHLRTHHNMSPEEYRERWSLPDDYPMVAPNYSAIRSRLAKENKLGQKVGK